MGIVIIPFQFGSCCHNLLLAAQSIGVYPPCVIVRILSIFIDIFEPPTFKWELFRIEIWVSLLAPAQIKLFINWQIVIAVEAIGLTPLPGVLIAL